MRKMMGIFICSLAVCVLLAACGGGGDKNNSTVITPTPTPVAKSAATVSGTAVISLSGLVAKAATTLDGAAIEIVSYDKSNNEIGRAAVTTDAAGGFSAQLSLLDAGGYVMLIASKEGYSQYQKRVDYTTPGNLELKASLQGLNVAFANMSAGSALTAGIGKSTESSFSFAVVKYPNGVKKALAGKAIRAAKSAGAASELEINIPKTSLPGVKTLKGELETFDPAKESDRFPGSYTGTDPVKGDGTMVSLAFDFIKITNADTGENLGKAAARLAKAGVTKAAATTTTVTRSIYTSSCSNLFLTDYNATAAGHQVPVWSLNPSTGKWVFIGEGTVVDSAGTIIASPTEIGCGGGTYNLKINVANTEFAKSWWNLDHIVFDTPTEVCLDGTFAYSNGDPLKNLSLSLSGSNLDYKWSKTDPLTGKYTLSTVLLNKNNTDRKGRLTYYDENGNYTGVDVVLDTTFPACKDYSKTNFTKPCEVSGKLVDTAEAGVASRWLNLQGSNFYRGTSTDSTGAFSSLVACNSAISLYMGGTAPLATFNVNGTVTSNADESTDDGAKVTLKTLTAPNIPPSGYVYLSPRSIKNTGSATASISAYDEDGNYPIAYKLTIGTQTYTGSIDGTTSYSASQQIPGSSLAVGDHTITLDLTDSKTGTRTIQAGTLTVSDGARPPVVTAYASQLYVNACGSTGSAITLYGSAYDPDGDGLSALWSGAGVSCAGNSSTTGYISSSCPVTVSGNTTYTYTVTDNSTPTPKSASRQVSVSTYSSAPWVSSLTATPLMVLEGATGTARDATATATAIHSDGISITGSWTVNGVSVASCPDVSVASGASNVCTYAIPDTAVVGDLFKFRFTATACGKTGYRETTVKYGIPPSAPTITSMSVPASVAPGSAAISLSAAASDPNGDAITWSWSIVSGGGSLGAGCSGSGATPVSSTCSYTPPATTAAVTLRFTASDGTLTNTSDRTVSVTVGTSVGIN